MTAVLVVEDLPAIRAWLVETAQFAFPGAEVVAVARCSEGIEQMGQRAFNVALVDLGLPDGCGVEVIQALRSQQPTAVPVVVTSTTTTSTCFRRCRPAPLATCSRISHATR